jgi:uncharacterized membrane protein YdbT with pleckstrin-like domain
MPYYLKVLQPGETVRVVGRLHWLIYANAVLLLVIALAIALLAAELADPTQRQFVLVVALVVAVLGGLVFLGAWIRRKGTEIVVTDRRVIYKRGFIARRTVEMNISKVETVDVEQSIAGRLLGYGTVLIRGTGESLEPLRHVEAPLTIRNAITVG